MAKMTVKEHDIINFSMNADVGAYRYYDKEVLCKDGSLVVNLDGNDIPLDKVYHIEVVGAAEYIKREELPITLQKTARGFNTIELTDKYGAPFYVRQSSVDMSEDRIGIKGMSEPNERRYQGNMVGEEIYAILIDDKTWKAIKKARRLCRKTK